MKTIGVFGASGFIGGQIKTQLIKSGASVIGFSRSERISTNNLLEWKHVDPHDSSSFMKYLTKCDSIVVSIGSPPLPTFNKAAFEKQIQDNGYVCKTIIEAANESGVKHVVLINATMPSWTPAGYLKGKKISAEAAKGFADHSSEHGSTILYPGGVSGTRKVGSLSIPLWVIMSPLSKILQLSKRIGLTNSLENLAPTIFKNTLEPMVSVAKVAEIATNAAIEQKYRGKLTEIRNNEILDS